MVNKDVYLAKLWARVECPFYPRDALHSTVFAVVRCLSVCPSVGPSVTRRYCV